MTGGLTPPPRGVRIGFTFGLRAAHVRGVPANCGSGEQVGAGLDTNRIARKRFNGLESHPIRRQP